MTPRISASKPTIKQLHAKVKQAKQYGDLAMLQKAQGLLGVVSDISIKDIAATVAVTTQTIHVWLSAFILKGFDSFKSKKKTGRPGNLTKVEKKKLKQAIKKGPESCGYSSGCWNSALVQDYILKTFSVLYSVFYIAQLLRNLGMSYQKARFASAHLDPSKRQDWLDTQWPKIRALSKKKSSYLLFGDEASFPQWGSLSYTWAPKGEQPTIKTSGSRKGYKVFGLIDYWTGKFFYHTLTGRFNSNTYADFLRDVISKTRKHLIIVQDGARYHTSKEMQIFFYDNKARVTVFQMPAYSPDYNPIEQLWRKIKKKGVHLRYFKTFDDLMKKVDQMLAEFADAADEVLIVFGFYEKLKKA
jgi:transposase